MCTFPHAYSLTPLLVYYISLRTLAELDGVSQNYAQHLASGRAEAFSMLANSTALMTKYTPPSGTTWEPCDLMNVTVCKALSNPAVGTSTVVQVSEGVK